MVDLSAVALAKVNGGWWMVRQEKRKTLRRINPVEILLRGEPFRILSIWVDLPIQGFASFIKQ